MTELINKLYYLAEYQIDRPDTQTETEKELVERREALRDKIARRLGEDGQDMMEALASLNLKLETIRDQALFRAAMQLGAAEQYAAGSSTGGRTICAPTAQGSAPSRRGGTAQKPARPAPQKAAEGRVTALNQCVTHKPESHSPGSEPCSPVKTGGP